MAFRKPLVDLDLGEGLLRPGQELLVIQAHSLPPTAAAHMGLRVAGPVGGLVQHVPVVGHDDHRAVEAVDDPLQVLAAGAVEVRLRLAEEEYVGAADEAVPRACAPLPRAAWWGAPAPPAPARGRGAGSGSRP
jgi:hypothetical protein